MENLADLVNNKENEKSKAKGKKLGVLYYDATTDKIISEAVEEQ